MRNAARFFPLVPRILLILSLRFLHECTDNPPPPPPASTSPPRSPKPQEFIQHAETRLNDLNVKASRAAWVQSNFITDDTEQMAAEANEVLIGATTELAKQATRFDHLKMPPNWRARCCCSSCRPPCPPPHPTIPRNSPS